MSSFWKGLKLGFKALFTRPLQYLTDPVGTTTDIYKEELTNSGGMTDEEIEQLIQDFHDSGGPVTSIFKGYGDVTKGIGDAVESVGGIFKVLGRNFSVVLIVALVVVALWYFLMFRKAAS